MALKQSMNTTINLKGLDLYTPRDMIEDGRSPYAKNFRLFSQQTDGRESTISSRKGSSHYTTTLGKELSNYNESITGQQVAVDIIDPMRAFKFTAKKTARLTQIDLRVAKPNTSSGVLLIDVMEDANGVPGNIIASTGITSANLTNQLSWQSAEFINAVKLTQGKAYWVGLRMQDDAQGTYTIGATTSGDKSYYTNTNWQGVRQADVAINHRIYTAPEAECKGAYRLNRDNGVNLTIAAYGTSMYAINDANGEWRQVISGLSPNATEYNFANSDNKVFWVNGYDQLMYWDGQSEHDKVNLINNGDFAVGAGGWNAGLNTRIAWANTDGHSGNTCLQVLTTGPADKRVASQAISLQARHRYKVTFWAKCPGGSTVIYFGVNGSRNEVPGSRFGLGSGWEQKSFYFSVKDPVRSVEFMADNRDWLIDDVEILDTGVGYIEDTGGGEMPIFRNIIAHKDRLWGVSASNPNELIFSENPGNPSDNPQDRQWYGYWRTSNSLIAVPRPHNGSPITALASFQDALVVFTEDEKYIISGYDRGTFSLRKSTGAKGALSQRGVTQDENRIYFVSEDGFYAYNGSSDEKMSVLINPLFEECYTKNKIWASTWKNQVRFYMSTQGNTESDICAIYDKDAKEWLMDTEVYSSLALSYNDADDNSELVEFSSQVQRAVYAETQYSNLGAPIDFEYRLKYDGLRSPMQRKKVKHFFPILQGVDSTFKIELSADKDFQEEPKKKHITLSVDGSRWGTFNWGDGTLYGGNAAFKAKRLSFGGYARYWQFRVARRGVNNRVAFNGVQYLFKSKRL